MKCENHSGKRYLFAGVLLPLLLAVQLTGCAMTDALGLTFTEKEETGADIAAAMEAQPPVIVIESESTPELEEVAETEDAEEQIWDDENRIYTVPTASRDEILIRFVGDINFCDDYANMRAYHERNGNIEECVLPEVIAKMQEADVMIANNEFAYSDRGTPTAGKKYTFRAKPERVGMLHELGINAVSLANNHAYDWGPDALLDTIELLKRERIPMAGAGVNLDDAMKPVYFLANGKKIAFVSATQIERTSPPDTREATETEPGVLRTLDPAKFVEVIKAAEENSDFTIVYVHWGSENTDLVEASQRELAKKYVNAGADLIIGDHSHCLQGVDYVSASEDSGQDPSVRVPVFYSLGNFWFNSKTVDTCIVSVTIDTTSGAIAATEESAEMEAQPSYAASLSMKEIRFISCVQQGCRTRLADAADEARILNYMRGISNYACFTDDGIVGYIAEDQNTQNGVNTSPSRSREPAAPAETETAAETETPAETAVFSE